MSNKADHAPDPAWVASFPALRALESASRQRLIAKAVPVSMPQGAVAFRPGHACEAFILVTAGSIRVQMLSETGREVVLYRVERGQTCILTTACLLGRIDYPAEAVVESPVDAVLIPRAAFSDLLDHVPLFRDYVFEAFGRRLLDLLAVVEKVAFRRVDLRLARFLVERKGEEDCLRLSHHDLAVELGTVREVVSRQLKEFERRSWVALHRGRIDVRNADALRRFGKT